MRVCFPGYSHRATLVLLRRSMGKLPALRSVSENGPAVAQPGLFSCAVFVRMLARSIASNSAKLPKLSKKQLWLCCFVSLFAFFLESFAHMPLVGILELRSIPAGQLTGGGASLGWSGA
jgi:hypothetical protein